MPLIQAYDEKTGERLPYLVPDHFIGHPVLGAGMTDKPPKQPKIDVKEKK